MASSPERKPPFGSRFITAHTDIWTQNAWDNVPPPSSHDTTITHSLSIQRAQPVSENEKEKCYDRPERFWDTFYKTNTTNFFRDRKWLHQEFPELVDAMREDKGDAVIVELGCGTGSSIYPLLSKNANPKLQIKAYDYSAQAIKFVQANPMYSTNDPGQSNPVVGSISASSWDITSPDLPPNLPEGSADIIILVFVLSALRPEEWAIAVKNIHRILKPSGQLLLRDYGRYDLTQLRFKAGRLLEDNFYIRGDKTRVYFFELDELAFLFTGSKAPAQTVTKATPPFECSSDPEGDDFVSLPADPSSPTADPSSPVADPSSSIADPIDNLAPIQSSDPQIHPLLCPPPTSSSDLNRLDHPPPPPILHLPGCLPHPLFSVDQLGTDRRLIVNRKRKVKMYRVWVQGIFRKI